VVPLTNSVRGNGWVLFQLSFSYALVSLTPYLSFRKKLSVFSLFRVSAAKLPLFFCSNSGNQKSVSYTPRSFEVISALNDLRSSSVVKVILALFTLLFTPVLILYGRIPADSITEFMKAVVTGWDSLAHFSVYPLFSVTLLVSFYFAHSCGPGLCYKKSDVSTHSRNCCNVCSWITPIRAAQMDLESCSVDG